MKTLLFLLFVSSCLVLKAQTTFRILEPGSLGGVYAFKAPATGWGSPDLSVVGNWFSDTVYAANDGTAGEACGPLIHLLTGNFGIARRSGCELGVLLTHMQNAGATGAIIIDTVDGRPLAFPSDPLSPGVTIPFLLVSKSQGDSLLARLAANETVKVEMGNKTGVHAVDLGLYKDRCLWYRYALNHEYSDLIDTDFGAWVYNRGTTSQADIVLALEFSTATDTTQLDAGPFDLAAGDSSFIPFTLPAGNTLTWGDHTMRYRLLVPADDDTTDNTVSTIVRTQYNHASYVLDYPLLTSANADYLLPGSSPLFGDSAACFIIKQPGDGFGSYLCEINIRIHVDPALLPAYIEWEGSLSTIQNTNGVPDVQQADHLLYYSGWEFTSTSDFEISIYTEAPITESDYIGLYLYNMTSTPFQLLFSSDYYPDERIRDGQTLQAFYYMNPNLPVPEFTALETALTPVIDFHFINECISTVDELSETRFEVFPNPAEDFLFIQTELPWTSYELLDLSGTVYTQHSFTDDAIFIGNLATGMYLIRLTDAYGRKSQRLFVKN